MRFPDLISYLEKLPLIFDPFLSLELKSAKLSYNFPRHEIKSGKRIANFPAFSKDEEKRVIFFSSTKSKIRNQMDMWKILLCHPVRSEKMARIERRGLVKAAASFSSRSSAAR